MHIAIEGIPMVDENVKALTGHLALLSSGELPYTSREMLALFVLEYMFSFYYKKLHTTQRRSIQELLQSFLVVTY